MVNPRARNKSKFKAFLTKHILPIVIAFVVILFGLFGPDVALWLRFDRNGIFSGEIWRLFTGHFAHMSWTHLLMNLLGLALTWGLFGHHLPTKRWVHTIAFAALGTSLLLLILDPNLHWYVGLSGVLHGMFIVGCLYDLRSGRWDSKLLLGLMLGKILWEQLRDPTIQSASLLEQIIGGSIAVDAHLFGTLMGFLTYLIFRRIEGRQAALATQHN